MVNHILRDQMMSEQPTKPEPNVKIRNKTSIGQCHGRFTLNPGEWTPVPKSLALRLCESEPQNYEQWSSRMSDALNAWKIPADDVQYKHRVKPWPTVRIVIPVFNSPILLQNCLASLAKTAYYKGKMAVTIVDNASTDKETLRMLRFTDHKVIRINDPAYFSTAVNTGMRADKADFYVLLNQDCKIIDPNWLKQLISWMDFRKHCAVAGPKLLYPFKGDEPRRVQHAGITIPKGSCAVHRFLGCSSDASEVNYFEKVQAVTGAVMAIRASAIDQVGYLDESLKFGCEDVEFCLRVTAQGAQEVWYVPTSVAVHRDHGVRDTNKPASPRIQKWASDSDQLFRSQWGTYIDRCASESVAFVLPEYNPVAGGCRVVAAVANRFIQCGMRTTVYVMNERAGVADPDFPQFFEIKHISSLRQTDTLVATRFDTVEATRSIPAKRRFYLVQQIETIMARYCGATKEDVMRSYLYPEYEIITIGDHLAKQLSAMGRNSTILDVGLYADLYPFDPHKMYEEVRVLMYGCSADYKGSDDVPMIADALRKKFGAGITVNSFHRDCEKPAWADAHFRPQKTSEVAAVYSDHDIYVYPSLSDGFAMTPIEAMACGTPVILTDFPGKDQYAKNKSNCYIVPFRDVDAIVDAVGRMIGMNRVNRHFLRTRARETAEKYDWARVGAQYVRTILEAPL